MSQFEDLLYYNMIKADQVVRIHPIQRGILYYIVLRVIPAKRFNYYKDVFRHLENLCSLKLDGFIR